MAVSLFILFGRAAPFKTLQLQAWRLRSLPSAVSLCTKPEDSKKVSKKNESGSITNTKADTAQKLSDEDLRKFLTRKTVVAFPQRANHPSLEGEPVFSSTRYLSKNSEEEESSSSSGSESDSSSDSDEEEGDDNNSFKNIVKTKVSFPRRDPISSGDSAMNANKTSEKYFSQEQVKSKQHVKVPHHLKTTETPNNQEQFYQAAPDDKLLKTDLVKPAVKQSPKERPLYCTDVGTRIVENRRSAGVTSKQFVASVPETASSTLPLTKPMLHQSVVQNLTSLQQKESVTNEVQKTEMQRTASVLQEVLDDGIPVAETTENGETFVEAGVQTEQQSTLQETKPPVETAQETFDISSYKNLQHHEYTPYTFVDYDVLLSERRLPQPSSGRSSPRH
ncbi:NADH dehydrogenase [ubiquinone] flavoprotein 3, mitochondrial [Anolis carolinensis]|uniref:NADH dehydrogenase [ubiquinone] flavoprotein 3, mitochondrial n=1 Tax=Anolis carolinensis TaxID=28377 RepID=UPI0002038E79|nr:PREDICTED: NADH dehydrogenase [ubiquinone] flavoprotein 3, mitochondrial [Anolis carolinensis]|eukprot:XP_003219030.1 PREDICTED: NADH dehydrogenase [ubiquinone] flavoprotein 3, mitochondrial [Anolis carolinensis]